MKTPAAFAPLLLDPEQTAEEKADAFARSFVVLTIAKHDAHIAQVRTDCMGAMPPAKYARRVLAARDAKTRAVEAAWRLFDETVAHYLVHGDELSEDLNARWTALLPGRAALSSSEAA